MTTRNTPPHILMCPPDFYGIEYEINPWMSTARQADHAVAVEQWNGLRQQIATAGAQVSLLEPVDGLPDLVFTANAALIFGQRAVLARFRHPQRQGEEPHNRRWLGEHGFEVVDCRPGTQLRRRRRRALLRRHAVRRLPHAQRRHRPSGGSADCSAVA